MYDPDPAPQKNESGSEFYNVQHTNGETNPIQAKPAAWKLADKRLLKYGGAGFGLGLLLAIINAVTDVGGSWAALLAILIVAAGLFSLLAWVILTVIKHDF